MKKYVIRLLFAFVAFMTTASMSAENKLWIDNFSVSQEATTVYVQMENDPAVAALQFTLELPDELEIDPSEIEGATQYVYRVSERLNNTQQFMCSPNYSSSTYKVAVFSMSGETFVGTEGPVVAFKVKVKDSVIEESKSVEIKLSDIIMSTAKGDRLECESESTCQASVNAKIQAYSSGASIVANPGSQITLPINFDNSVIVQGLQMDVTLPEGFTMENRFEHSDRVSNGASVSCTYNAQDNTYRLVLVDITGENAIRNEGNGRIFDCFVNVPAEFVSGDKIVISNVVASRGQYAFPGDGATIGVINGNDALAKANAVVTDLQSKLDAALATIAETCSDVKDNFKGEAIQQSIDELKAAVEAAYGDLTLTPNYENVMAPAAGIETAIAKLVTDAQAAQAAEVKRVADNKAAYDATVAAIAVLQTNLDNSVAVIDSEYAAYKDAAAIESVQKMITDATAAAKSAFDAVAEEGNYAYALDEAGINTAIEGLVLAAQAAKDKAEADAEAARQAENKAAYEAALEGLNALYAHYREVVEAIQNDYKAFEDVSAELAVRNKLDAAKDDIEKAYKAVEKEGKFEYVLDSEGLTAAIDQLLADAKAKKEAADAETVRQAENKVAYDKVLGEIAALQSSFDSTVATIKKDYAGFEDAEAEAAVQAQINALKTAADAAFAAVEKEGKFEYTFDAAPIQAAIEKLLADAKAKKETADAETLRQAENKAAYDKVLGEIATLQSSFDSTVATIKKDYAGFEDAEAEAAVQAQIDALKTAADAAFAAVEKEGKFEYTFDAAPIQAAIEKLLADAKAKKEAADAETLRQAENKAAYDKVLGEIAALQSSFDSTVATIKKDYAGFEDAEAEAAVQAQIDALKTAADAAFAAVEKEGKFEYTFDAAPVQVAIDKLLEEAKAKKEAADAEEAARVEANQAAYDAVLAEIAAVQEEFDVAIAMITNEYPEYNATVDALAITKALSQAKSDADAALKAVEKEGTFSYVFDAQAIRDMIAKMIDNAKNSGVDSIEAEAEAGNIRIFTLDGKQHARPVVGEVNVIVRNDGTTSKVMVK